MPAHSLQDNAKRRATCHRPYLGNGAAMRVLFIKPRFEQPILDETKLTTFRGRSRASKKPKGPPKIGEILSFRVWVGRPYGKGSTVREGERPACLAAWR